jgi:hypothetical protein
MTQNDATAFPAWLDELLSERKRIRSLLHDLERARVYADTRAISAAEDRIRALTLEPLDLKPGEAPSFLEAAVVELPYVFALQRCAESPRSAFDYPVGGTVITNPSLQNRLIDLLAPLDYVIERERAV